MKHGWQKKRLGEVCEITKGRKPALKGNQSSGDLPYLVAKVMRGTAEPQFASAKDRNSISVAESETIIICDGSNSGEVFTGFRGILSSTMGKVSKKVEIDDDYLRAFLSSTFEVFNGAKTGAAIPHLDKDAMYQLEFPMPSLSEQRRIVGVLDEAFSAITSATANAEKNLESAKALFQSHLQSVFIHRGNGWTKKRLIEVSKAFGRGKSKHRPRNDPSLYGGPYPFIQTGDISNADHWLTDYTQTYSELGLAQSSLWPKGTICIALVGATVGETAILDFPACFPDSVIGIVVDDELADGEYVEFLLQSFKAMLKDKGKGTARDNINLGTFENETFPFPALKKQQEVAAKLNELRAETKRLESILRRKLAALNSLKKSLLHQAFSGQL